MKSLIEVDNDMLNYTLTTADSVSMETVIIVALSNSDSVFSKNMAKS
jgi:hypothetical protein